MENIATIASASSISVNRFMASIYRWMTGALVISALVALWGASSPAFIQAITKSSGLLFGLIILQLVAVVALAGWVQRMSALTAGLIFLGYSALTGLTLSSVFLVYTASSIVLAFGVTAGMFGVMSVYAHITKRNLAEWGSFLFMALIGLIIASVVNLFMHSPMLTWITTYAGILIFTGLVAYDTQRLIALGHAGEMKNLAIHGALSLYLDFINLFLHLLRVIGNRR